MSRTTTSSRPNSRAKRVVVPPEPEESVITVEEVDDATESADILQGVAEENEDEESDEYEIEVCHSTCHAC